MPEQPPQRTADVLRRAGCGGTRTSGSEGGGEQTTARKRGTAARLRPYFSIVQRKLLQPNDFTDVAALARTLNAFEQRWSSVAEPFDWRFTRDHLERLLKRLSAHEPELQQAA